MHFMSLNLLHSWKSKFPTTLTLAKINEESGKNQDDPDNERLRRPHSALGDTEKPIEWRKYSLNVDERMKKIREIQESDNKMELLTSFLKVDTDEAINGANVKKCAWLLKGGQLVVEPMVNLASEEGGVTAIENQN